jgi:putative transposase
MLLMYQYRLQPTLLQEATLNHWGKLLRRHWNYALGQRLDWLRRARLEPSASSRGKTRQAPSRS